MAAGVRHLYVMRHGKSDWGTSGGDHERPLKKRGRRAAVRMAELLRERDEVPERVLASSAVRARTTAELLAAELGLDVEVCPELYGAGPAEVLELVRARGGDAARVLTCGHEPTCSALVAEVTGGERPEFPTAAIARLDIAGESWAEADRGSGTLGWLVTPRSLD